MPGQFELAGIVIVVLGLPWSLLLTLAVLGLNSSSAWLLAIAYTVSCIVNGWLLYKLGVRLSLRRR